MRLLREFPAKTKAYVAIHHSKDIYKEMDRRIFKF